MIDYCLDTFKLKKNVFLMQMDSIEILPHLFES